MRELRKDLVGIKKKPVQITIFLIITVFALLVMLTPYMEETGSVDLGEGGGANLMDMQDRIDDMENPVARFMYTVGDGGCHQMPSRSYTLNGNQMPFCTRCLGVFLGMSIGMAFVLFIDVKIRFLWLVVGLVPIGIDGTLQLLTDYTSNNPLRMATGLLAGIITSLAIGTLFTEMKEMKAERERASRDIAGMPAQCAEGDVEEEDEEQRKGLKPPDG